MAAETKIDPMHQFQISPIFGNLDGSAFVFTNSALWMLVVLACITGFMLMGMKRELVPGRWQAAAEGMVGFVNSMVEGSIGPQGRAPLDGNHSTTHRDTPADLPFLTSTTRVPIPMFVNSTSSIRLRIRNTP